MDALRPGRTAAQRVPMTHAVSGQCPRGKIAARSVTGRVRPRALAGGRPGWGRSGACRGAVKVGKSTELERAGMRPRRRPSKRCRLCEHDACGVPVLQQLAEKQIDFAWLVIALDRARAERRTPGYGPAYPGDRDVFRQDSVSGWEIRPGSLRPASRARAAWACRGARLIPFRVLARGLRGMRQSTRGFAGGCGATRAAAGFFR